MAHCDVALAASGTVTVEAALLGAPMVVFYRVTALTWALGRHLVSVPYFSMVNLIAGKRGPRADPGRHDRRTDCRRSRPPARQRL